MSSISFFDFDIHSHHDGSSLIMLMLGGGRGIVLASDYSFRLPNRGRVESHMYDTGFIPINRMREDENDRWRRGMSRVQEEGEG
jgi:hypothetical protein